MPTGSRRYAADRSASSNRPGKTLPGPFRDVWAVRGSESAPRYAVACSASASTPGAEGTGKTLSRSARLSSTTPPRQPNRQRLEVILAGIPGAEDESYLGMLRRAAPGLIVEGRLGPLVTVVANPSQAPALAALPDVIGSAAAASAATVLGHRLRSTTPAGSRCSRPAARRRLQAMGRTGRGTRLAVVDSDFRGWEKLVGKGLPSGYAPDRSDAANATRLAARCLPRRRPRAWIRHAPARSPSLAWLPEINLTLIRIDPASPYMLEAAARGHQRRSRIAQSASKHRLYHLRPRAGRPWTNAAMQLAGGTPARFEIFRPRRREAV